MTDDPLFRELAQVNQESEAEERSRLDERWDRLAAGTLTANEEAELRALAATSDEAREAYEAFRPLGPEFQASVVQAIRKQGLAPEGETAKAPRAKLLPFPLRPRFAGWAAAAAAAAAAAVMFFLGPAASFPNYQLALTPISSTRGEQLETGKIKVFPPGHRVPVMLKPPTRAASHIWPWDTGCYISCGHEARRLDAFEKAMSATGAARMECAISGDLRPGMCTLWAVIGRWGKLPDPSDLRLASSHEPIRARDWFALGEEIQIQPPDP
jgi:hypothetical protein